MSGRKLVLAPQKIATSQSLAANFTSVPTVIDFQDNVAYQINVTTSNSVGTFAVQASLDYQPANGFVPAVAGTWIPLTLGGGVPTIAAADNQIMIYLNQLPYRALRLSYTSSVAGTGTADIYIMSKMV